MGVGDRGAQFIAHNMKNLTRLNIGSKYCDAGNNGVKNSGASAIAQTLKNLTWLGIGKSNIYIFREQQCGRLGSHGPSMQLEAACEAVHR